MVKLMITIIYLFQIYFSVLYQAQYPTNGLVHSYAGSYFPMHIAYVHTGYNTPAYSYVPTISNQQQTDKLGVW